MNFKITTKAFSELKNVRQEQNLPEDVIVRVSVQGGGCSGFMYGLEFEEASKFNTEKDAVVAEEDEMKIVIDSKSILYLNETVLDFNTTLSKRGFTFDNPQAQKTCGCGASFSV